MFFLFLLGSLGAAPPPRESDKCINNSFVQNSPLVIIGSKLQPISSPLIKSFGEGDLT